MALRDLIDRLRHPGGGPPVVAVVRLSGTIGMGAPIRRAINLAGVAGTLERAFSMGRLKAVALAINSPGGSPVQSALIHKRVRALAAEKEVPVFAFAEDVAASGGYWLACAGDEIFADANSIVGSIGVVSAGFGFTEAMRRAGVRRRLYVAGERKSLLDPFLNEDPDDVERLKAIQADIHESFKALVRDRRAGRLKAPEEDLFSGDIWTGRQARELGLVDGIGDLRTVMRERFGDKVRLRAVGGERDWLRRRLPLGIAGPRLPDPADWADGLLAAVEERALWSRFGL